MTPLSFHEVGSRAWQSRCGTYSISLYPPLLNSGWHSTAFLRPRAGERLAHTLADISGKTEGYVLERAKGVCQDHQEGRT